MSLFAPINNTGKVGDKKNYFSLDPYQGLLAQTNYKKQDRTQAPRDGENSKDLWDKFIFFDN